MQLDQSGDGRYIGGARQLEETDMIYAVYEQTKEHRVVGLHSPILTGVFNLVQADKDGWIDWNGEGECPLPDGALHEVKWKNGDISRDDCPETWNWVEMKKCIIAYRPIRTEREEWIEAAKEHYCDDSTATMEFIYDALASGELPHP